MGARKKLNSVHIQLAILIAVVVGVVFSSWFLFVLVLILFLGLAVYSKDIR